MGQNPAKVFPWPTPFGQSPDSNVLNQAMAPPQAPLNSFLPLNQAEPNTPNTPVPTSGPTKPALPTNIKNPIIRGLMGFLLLVSMAWGTTSVTGNMKSLGTGNVTGGFMRFWLRGCAGNQPRIAGTGLIAPTLGGVFYFDLPANASGVISGTLYSNRDVTGLLGGDIECGGSTTSTWYGMQAFFGGKGGPEVAVIAKNTATIDISNITPISTNPVITAPTGDSTYARLDGGNMPFVAQIKELNAGVYTNSQMNDYVISQIGTTDPGAFFFASQGNNYATDAFTGIVTAPVGATAHQFNGANLACITSAVSSPLGGNENCVGVYAAAQLNANNTAAWGQNVAIGIQAGVSGFSAVGTEADMNLPATTTPTKFIGYYLTGSPLQGTMPSGPTMGNINDHVAAGFGGLYSPGSTQFPVMFWSARGAAATGLMLDAACYTGACNSQTIQLGANNGSSALTSTIQADQKGQLLVSSSATGVGFAPPSSSFANLSSSASNGTMIFCTDCKNVVDNSATAGAACLSGGQGAFAKRENNRWDCN